MDRSGRRTITYLFRFLLAALLLLTVVLASGGESELAVALASPVNQVEPNGDGEGQPAPPAPDVEKARILVTTEGRSVLPPARNDANRQNSQSEIGYPTLLASQEVSIYSLSSAVIERIAAAGYITESWFSFAPGIDNFRTNDWLNEVKPEFAACSVQLEGESLAFGDAVDMIADTSGVNPRVLLVVILMRSSFSTSNDFCHQAQQQVIELLELAGEMTDLRLVFRYGSEEDDNLPTNQSLLQAREVFHNDVSFAVAQATSTIATRAGRTPEEITTEFYELFNQYFGDPKDVPPYLLSDEAIDSVTYLMPFYSGERPFTGGPHGGGTTNSCAAVSLSDVSGLDFGSPNEPSAVQNAVVAIASGEIVGLKDTTSVPGRWVAIRHDNGVVSMYWHLTSINSGLDLNQRVSAGAYLGDIGNTGCPGCSVHIHVELRQGGANYNQYSGIGAPVPWTERVIDGWRIYPQVFNSGHAANYNGTALKDSAINGNFQKEISACGGKVIAAVEQNFPYTNETNTDITKFAQINRSTLLTSTNNVHCPAYVAIGEKTSEFTDDLCGVDTSDNTPPSASGFTASVTNGRTAEITTSGVQDNSGGSGVREVRFSAKYGGSWKGIGTDSSAPYTLTWDMCSSGVPNGDVELGMEVRDNADNYWIWSEHYGNPHINKDSACGGSGETTAGGPWETRLWMNQGLAGYVNWSGTYTWSDGWPYIWLDWGIEGPVDGWSDDDFSLRMWRNVYFPGGRYEFRTDADDGHRVYVDGQLVVDHWWAGSAGGGKDISKGLHEVKVEYFENTGNAKLSVQWYGPGYPQPDWENPGGRISSPTNLAGINVSPFTIWTEAWDDVSGVNYVEFWAHYCLGGDCQWRKLGSDSSDPYTYDWDWTSIGEQHVWLAVDVFDKVGRATGSAGGWVEVDLDKTNPQTQIDSPADFSYLTGNAVPIAASATDGGSGVGAMQFFAGYDDGSGNYWHELGFDTDGGNGWQWTWDAAGAADQRDVSFYVYAYDRAGNYAGAGRWANILDRASPTSQILTLPPRRPAFFLVKWAGVDATAGVAGYDVQYRQNGGSWQNWLVGTPEESSTFYGAFGNTYDFRSRASDMAGMVEAWPSAADATTTVDSQWPTADVFWYAPGTATDSIFLFNGNSTYRSISRPVNGTYTPLMGNYNGDAFSDVFWYAPGLAADSVFLSNGDGAFQSIPQKVNGWYAPLVGDFDGDGADDIFWYAPGATADSLFLANWDGTFRSVAQRVNGAYTPLVGDFNADGADDIFWYAPGTAADSLSLANGDGTFRSVAQKVNGASYKPLVGDFNGDGADDIFWYGPGAYVSDSLFLSNADGTFRAVAQKINGASYTPLVGDFDGDGRADIFWYAPGLSGDSLFLANGDGTFRAVAQQINGSYTPLVGDFNGDGAADIFWYAPGTAGDSLYLANGDGTFRSLAQKINGAYTPLVGSFD